MRQWGHGRRRGRAGGVGVAPARGRAGKSGTARVSTGARASASCQKWSHSQHAAAPRRARPWPPAGHGVKSTTGFSSGRRRRPRAKQRGGGGRAARAGLPGGLLGWRRGGRGHAPARGERACVGMQEAGQHRFKGRGALRGRKAAAALVCSVAHSRGQHKQGCAGCWRGAGQGRAAAGGERSAQARARETRRGHGREKGKGREKVRRPGRLAKRARSACVLGEGARVGAWGGTRAVMNRWQRGGRGHPAGEGVGEGGGERARGPLPRAAAGTVRVDGARAGAAPRAVGARRGGGCRGFPKKH
ncbi:MAG: hypothetical protein J3K34DRAFT_429570 [Monoraphidium minutum]|nr:MAG: hypothetical protein J3K34DRAFT_429570 [Monoraphidium minutum]